MKKILLALAMLMTVCAYGSQPTDTLAVQNGAILDSTLTSVSSSAAVSLGDTLVGTKKPKNFRFCVLGAPSYSNTTSLMLTVCGIAEYRWNRADSLIQTSNASIYANASFNGILTLGIGGKNFIKQDAMRLNYDLFVQKTRGRTWGIGYERDGQFDENETNFKRIQLKFEPEMLFRVANNFYIGPTINMEWNKIYDLDRINPEWIKEAEAQFPEIKKLEMLSPEGNPQNLHYFDFSCAAFGFGYTLNYDTRDNVLDAKQGINVRWSQMFYLPCFVSSKMKYDEQLPSVMKKGFDYSGFFCSDFTFNWYQKLWKGAVLAFDLHGRYNYGDNVPFSMMAEVGGSSRMRGYYQGRYRDKGLLETQLELRQHIWGWSGVALWGGGANIFPSFKDMRIKNTLGNFGIGYRLHFLRRILVRADIGFTKHGVGIVFGANQAF
ncbi:MAG: BamA/TamA family outer membrane protein [Bacteroidaceae bacterium]|nr:BamA/TamA family outer membrane protein [Bacteroidaceae bacterium]